MSSSRSAWRDSSSCRSSAAASSPRTACRSPSSWPPSTTVPRVWWPSSIAASMICCCRRSPPKACRCSGAPSGSEEATQWLEQYFEREIEPVLSPLGLDPARPFPRIQNKSLNFIVRLEGKDAFDRDSELAIVQAPRSLPRVVPAAGRRRQPRLRAALDHRAGLRAEALHRHQGDRLLPVPRHPQQRPVRRRRRDRRPEARARGRARAPPLRRGRAARDLERLPRGHGEVPAGAVRLQRPRHLPGGRTGEPEPPLGGVRPGAAPGPQVPDLHSRDARSAWSAAPISSPASARRTCCCITPTRASRR